MIEPAANVGIGVLWHMRDFPGERELILSNKAGFVARSANGAATVESAADAFAGTIEAIHDFSGSGY